MIKKFVFYIFFFSILILIILIFDFALSKTILKYNHCISYQEYFYDLKKNCKGKYRFKKSFPLVKTYTDEMGLRVSKSNQKKNPDNKNIFIYGDSFTYGVGLEYEKTYVGLIEKRLENYNVYNFGVGSYSPSVYLYKLKQYLSRGVYPNKVLIFLDLTDVIDESTRWTYDKTTDIVKLTSKELYVYSQKEEKKSDEYNFKLMKNIASYINYNLRNLRADTKLKLTSKYKIKQSIQGNFTYTPPAKLDKRFWKKDTFNNGIFKIQKVFNDLNEIADKNNFQLYLVIYPWAETLEFGQNAYSWSNFAKNLCVNKNCKVIDAIPTFTDYKKKNKNWVKELYFLNDEHFNEEGAKLLSQIVLSELERYEN